ncbi:hypothetical protein N8I77_010869 [Diaporthe amygdali]|uniref:FAD-binding PCMH-type domain-containing protein n=1 Tax=Phomopsis amygdali TaxID=1214568 RepID=A0AAD9VZU4_PHOAM|nr:hypothetical protein N8I77_010869 [Diaporthe amygdali]
MINDTPNGSSASSFAAQYQDPAYQKAHAKVFFESGTPSIPRLLPPGVSEASFNRAIEEFKNVVGTAEVVTGDGLVEYVDPYELNEDGPERKLPSAAVRPQSNEELRGVLKIANKYSIPLWTFSRGKNLSYGGPAPRLNGAVSLDLHRMNRVIEVNEEFSYAVVEPGVSFQELFDYCLENKLRVWPSVPSLGWGSVVGNTVDRGVGYTPTAVHHQNIAGMEVMLADGDIIRTGQFAQDGNPSAHLSKFSFGPSVEGLFLQSNLGVVTKLGIWLSPSPEAYMACSLDVFEFEDLEALVDLLSPLRRNGILPNSVWVIDLVERLANFGRRADHYDGEGSIPPHVLKQLQQKYDLGYWTALWPLQGSKDVVEAHFNTVKRLVEKKLPRARLQGTLYAGDEGVDDGLLAATKVKGPHGGIFVGVPNLDIVNIMGFMCPKDGSGVAAHMDFSPIMPSSGKAIMEWANLTREICESKGLDLCLDFFMHERHVVLVNVLIYNKADKRQTKVVGEVVDRLFTVGRERKYPAYRTHINFMDKNAAFFDFNDHAQRRFIETLKDTLDPKGILSPGKMGIWPRAFSVYRDHHDDVDVKGLALPTRCTND